MKAREEYRILFAAAREYGEDHQLRMVQEECSELAVVLHHYFRGRADLQKVAEEMVDVQIMLDQLGIFVEKKIPPASISQLREAKLKRLHQRIRDERFKRTKKEQE